MSRLFGPIRQNGYVVRDIEAAMTHWSTVLGVGPWFYTAHAPIQDFMYRGTRSDPDVAIALANSGPLQIELIQQHNDGGGALDERRYPPKCNLASICKNALSSKLAAN